MAPEILMEELEKMMMADDGHTHTLVDVHVHLLIIDDGGAQWLCWI
jgi:hypothetical protein